MKNLILTLFLFSYVFSFSQDPEEFVISGFVYPSMTREIIGTYSHETMFIRKFKPVLSSGIITRKTIVQEKWYLSAGGIFQNYGVKEKFFDIFPTKGDINFRETNVRYGSFLLGGLYKKKNVYLSLLVSNSFFLSKKNYLNNLLIDSKIYDNEKWLIGFNAKIGYDFILSKKSSISVELIGEINTKAKYFSKILKSGFQFGYYTYGLGLAYSYNLFR